MYETIFERENSKFSNKNQIQIKEKGFREDLA